jgi:hypothetical protein
MSSLAKCIELAGLHPIEANRLKASARAIRVNEGFSAQEANEMAVKQAIADLNVER